MIPALELPTTYQEAIAALHDVQSEVERRLRMREVLPIFKPMKRPSRYKGLHGGRGGMKSHFFAEELVKQCERGPEKFVCIREVQKTLKESVKSLIESKIKKFGIEHKFHITNTEIVGVNGSHVMFQGMQHYNADSIKSLEGRTRAWVEEAQSFSQRSLDLLRPTIREAGSEIWFSWNPRKNTDPVDVLLRGAEPPPNSIVLRTNYWDNPYFPEVLQIEMEYDKKRDRDKYEHVWEGAYEKHSEARVFKNWVEEEFDTPIGAAFHFGGDWGYSVDPSVLIRCFLVGNTLYIDHEVYMIGCEIDHLPALFDTLDNERSPTWPHNQSAGMAREWVVTADNSRPETISYMQRHGYRRMEPSIKGKDSVKEGVIFLQGLDIKVHPRCKHTIDELKFYSYKQDKDTEEVLPILEDKKNHVIDSLRYAVEKIRRAKVKKFW